jgi:signal peptidase II
MQAARGASLNHSDPETSPAPRVRSRQRPYAVLAGVALGGYALDVLTKLVAVDRLSETDTVEVLGSWLTLTLVRNPGAAFSTGTSMTLLLSMIAIGAATFVLYLSRRLGSTLWAVGLGFLLAGILGNLTDRVFRDPGPLRGHVIDFLQLPNWPVFNVADICINIAAAVIIVQAIRGVRIDGTKNG